MIRLLLVVLLCSVTLSSSFASNELTGIVRVHVSPIVGRRNNAMSQLRSAFLVHKEKGIFAAINADKYLYKGSDFALIYLETSDGNILYARVLGCVDKMFFLQVEAKERHFLNKMHTFTFRKIPPLHQEPVRYLASWDDKVWREASLSSLWGPQSLYNMTSEDHHGFEGVPVIAQKDSAVVGVAMGFKHSTRHVFPGIRLEKQLDYFLRHKKFFPGHLGIFYTPLSVQNIEVVAQKCFAPKDYDLQKLPYSRLVVVEELFGNTKQILSNPLRVFDVILAVDGVPVYSEAALWDRLVHARHASQRTVQVRIWRYGSELSVDVPLLEHSTDLPTKIYRYGNYAFSEVNSLYDASTRFVQVGGWGEFVPKRLVAINGHKINTLEDVRMLMDVQSSDAIFLHLLEDLREGRFLRSVEHIVHTKGSDLVPRTLEYYDANQKWRKECLKS